MLSSGKLIFLLTFFAFLIQSSFLFFDKPDELMAIPLVLILGGAGAYWLGRGKGELVDFQVNIFLIAFSIRILVGLVFYGWDLTGIFGDEDSSGYITGWLMAENWYRNGYDGFVSDLADIFFLKTNVGQSIIWGIPMFIAGGPSRMIVSVINSFAGAFLVIVICKIALKIFGNHTARIAAILVAFWPSIILFSAGTSKEILVILFEWTILYLAIRNPNGLTPKDGLLSIPAFLALYVTRFYSLYMVVGAFVFRALTSERRHLVRNGVISLVVVGAILGFLGSSGIIDRDFERLERQNEGIERWRENVAQNTGSGTEVMDEYSGSVLKFPVATAYFFLAPFPWEIFNGTLRNAFAVFENLAIIVILVMGFPAIRIFFKDKLFEVAPLLVFCILYAGFHIWGLSNVGLAWRHKQTVMPLLFMLAAVAVTQRTAAWQLINKSASKKEKEASILPTSRV